MVADVKETGETGQGRGGPKSREGHLVGEGMQGRNWVLAAMIFAVAMTFIDQTIVSIAVPNIQRELGLTLDRRAVGGQRLPDRAGGALRPGRPTLGHLRAHAGCASSG